MTHRWWYLRRGVAWRPVLGCCAAAAVAALLLARWPSTAVVLLPALLAALAAAAAFLFDEPSTAVVAVTPRGGTWRGVTRHLAALVPLSVWALVIALRPGDLPLSRPGWWLLGAATIVFASGVAAHIARTDNPTPGPTLAGLVVITVLAPVVAGSFLDQPIPFPIEGFSAGVLTFWLVVTGVAALLCAVALRPPVRRRPGRRVSGSGPAPARSLLGG